MTRDCEAFEGLGALALLNAAGRAGAKEALDCADGPDASPPLRLPVLANDACIALHSPVCRKSKSPTILRSELDLAGVLHACTLAIT
jgi:hypothetical protein